MNRITIILITFLTFFSLTNCSSKFEKRLEFEKEFKKHTENSDEILFDGDVLHPTYAYLINGKIIGIEYNGNGECGQIKKKYFLDKYEKIDKIILDKSYNNNCEKAFDSIYVIEPNKNKILAYSNSTNGKEIRKEKFTEKYLLNIEEYKNKIKNWHYR